MSSTRQANTPRDPMNADADDRELAEMVFPDCSAKDPEVSPVLSDLSGLPRTHVEVGAREVLLGDALRLAECAGAQGAELSLHLTADAFHMWQLWTPWLPEAGVSIRRAASALADWR